MNLGESLEAEIATMEYLKRKTTIPVPCVHGYSPGGALDPNNRTGLPFILLEFISGRPLDPKRLLEAPDDALSRFYMQLGDAPSQLCSQEFEFAGTLATDGRGGFTISSPNSVDLNTLQLQRPPRHIPRQSTATDLAMCRYEIYYIA